MKAPFAKFNPKLPAKQKAALKRVFKALKLENNRRDFFSFAVNARGQVEVHSLQRIWGSHVSRRLVIGKRGGFLQGRRYTNLQVWIAR